MENKVCSTCWDNKPVSKFKLTKKGNLVQECTDCSKAYQVAYQAEYKLKNAALISQKAKDKRIRNKKLGINHGYSERKTKENTHTCSVKGCYEEKTEFKGLTKYCKSHAFDKLYI